MSGPPDRDRVVVVGPVAPFRGGIAQHTTRLAEALAGIARVDVVSFSRLYPRVLYPGRFQVSGGEGHRPGAVHAAFVLDSLNPVTWWRTLRRVAGLRPRCVVIPWWTFFLAPSLGVLARGLDARDVPVVFVCHNVVDHEVAVWKRWLSRSVLRSGRRFVVHSYGQKRELEHLLGPVDAVYVPQPLFDHFPAGSGRLPRRRALELLFYGFIRPYKGLDVLLEAMTRLSGADVHLSIVGEPWGRSEAEWRRRIEAAGLAELVEFVPRYVTAAETAEYFCRADVVVLPYTSATGTAVAATAYRYGKPVIASDIGGLRDLVDHGVTGMLVPPGDAAALAAAIRRFAAEGLPGADVAIARLVGAMTWDHLARAVIGAEDGIAAGDPAPGRSA